MVFDGGHCARDGGHCAREGGHCAREGGHCARIHTASLGVTLVYFTKLSQLN